MSTVTFDVVRASTKYVVDENGDLSQVAANTPAFEYNADGTYKGMLVEEERENGIRNSEAGGSTNGVIGSGGALPTNWGTAGLNGIAVEIIGTGTEKGVEYVDIKFSGTATSTGQFSLRFDSISQITAAQNEFWSSSVFMKYTDQTDNPESVSLGIQQFDSTPTFLAVDSQTITLTNTLTRYKYENVEIDNASTASIINTVFFGITNTETYNFTVRFGLPQLEEGAHASSVIKTSGTSATRNKDDISNTSASTYIGQTAGTVYVEATIDNIIANANIITVSDGTDDNIVRITFNANADMRMYVKAGTTSIINDVETIVAGTYKFAIVYSGSDTRVYRDGVQLSSSTTSLTFTSSVDEIDIGQSFAGTGQSNNWIRAFAFYKRTLTDSEAIALTS